MDLEFSAHLLKPDTKDEHELLKKHFLGVEQLLLETTLCFYWAIVKSFKK